MAPPKKKEEEVDLSTLPPYLSLFVRLLPRTRASRAQKVLQSVYGSKRQYHGLIRRADVINWAKDHGLYMDPATITEKMKKDKNFGEIPTELTPGILAKAFSGFVGETTLQARKTKKETLESGANPKENPQGQKGPDQKQVNKGPAQKAVKGGKPQKEEETLADAVPLKEFEKACDMVWFLEDYPSSKEELMELGAIGQGLNCTIVIEEKEVGHTIDKEALLQIEENPEAFSEELRERLQEFIQKHGREAFEEPKVEEAKSKKENPKNEKSPNIKGNQRQQEKKKELQETKVQVQLGLAGLSQDDRQIHEDSNAFLALINSAQKMAEPASKLRQHIQLVVPFQFEEGGDESAFLREASDSVFEKICEISLDYVEFFEKWLPTKEKVPLKGPCTQIETKEPQPVFNESPAEVSAIEEKPLVAQPPPKKEKGKKEKEPKEQEAKKEPEVIPEAPLPVFKVIAEPPISQEVYNMQLDKLAPHQTDSGAILEAMLDQLLHNLPKEDTRSIPSLAERSINPINNRKQMESFDSWFGGICTSIMSPESRLSGAATEVTLERKEGETEEKVEKPRIIEMNDSLEVKEFRAFFLDEEPVSKRIKMILEDTKYLPGLERNSMPKIPEKSAALMRLEKSEELCFSRLTETNWSYSKALENFEKLLKEQNEGVQWSFKERKYVERLSKNTLKQILLEALIQEPIVCATKYEPLEDALLVAIYHRKAPFEAKLNHGWTNGFQVLPNFDLWIKHFKGNPELLERKSFIDMDYAEVGKIKEYTRLQHPNTATTWLATQFQIGNNDIERYRIIKEEMVIGLSPSVESGLSELWMSLKNGSRLLIESELRPASNGKDQKENGGNSKGESTLKEEKANEKFVLSYTLPAGLVVRFLSNGDIQQIRDNGKPEKAKKAEKDNMSQEEIDPNAEEFRIISGKGTVIRHLKNGNIQTLFANGNSAMLKKGKKWVSVNCHGQRRAKNLEDGSLLELDPIPCTIRTDQSGNRQTLIREDGVQVIKDRVRGTTQSFHSDGTKIVSSRNGMSIEVEHKDFAKVKVTLAESPLVNKTADSFPELGFNDLFERTVDGRLTEALLWDGTKVQGFKEMIEEKEGKKEVTQTWLVKMSDDSVAKIKESGQVVLISSKDRAQMSQNALSHNHDLLSPTEAMIQKNQGGESGKKLGISRSSGFASDEEANASKMVEMGEMAWWTELFGRHDEMTKTGVLVVDLVRGTMKTKDTSGKCVEVKLGESFEAEDTNGYWYDKKMEENLEAQVQEEGQVPRLFIVRNDNTGEELLDHHQIAYYKRLVKKSKEKAVIRNEKVKGYPESFSYSYFHKQKPHCPLPEAQIFLWKNLIQLEGLNDIENLMETERQKYLEWKAENTRQTSEFGAANRDEEQREKDFGIQQKIMSIRKSAPIKETYEEAIESSSSEFLEKKERAFLAKKEAEEARRKEEETRVQAEREAKEEKLRRRVIRNIFAEKNDSIIKNLDFHKMQLSERQKTVFECGRIVRNYFDTYNGRIWTEKNPQAKPNKIKLSASEAELAESLRAFGESVQIDGEPLLPKNETQQTGFKFSEPRMPSTQGVSRVNEERQAFFEKLKQESIEAMKASIQASQSPAIASQARGNLGAIRAFRVTDKKRMKKSTFQLIDEEQELLKKEQEVRTKHYYNSRKKENNVYGGPREETIFVQSILRPIPEHVPNMRHLQIEAPLERHIKLASIANEPQMNASSIHELRNEAKHETILKSTDKKHSLTELMNRKVVMASETNAKRDVSITPNAALFGMMKMGEIYQLTISIKNENFQALRLRIRASDTFSLPGFTILQTTLGALAPGLIREVSLSLDTNKCGPNEIDDCIEVHTSKRIYKVPVRGLVLEEEKSPVLEDKRTARLAMKVWNPQFGLESMVQPVVSSSPKKGTWRTKASNDDSVKDSGVFQKTKEEGHLVSGGDMASSEMLSSLKYDKNTVEGLDQNGKINKGVRKREKPKFIGVSDTAF